MNERYFAKHDMRPLFVEELAVHPGFQGLGIGSFLLEQLEHLARVRGCTHLVLEVAENNDNALSFYKARSFFRLDAAIFLAKKVVGDPSRTSTNAKTSASPSPSRSTLCRSTIESPWASAESGESKVPSCVSATVTTGMVALARVNGEGCASATLDRPKTHRAAHGVASQRVGMTFEPSFQQPLCRVKFLVARRRLRPCVRAE
jgi:hypothetical protein